MQRLANLVLTGLLAQEEFLLELADTNLEELRECTQEEMAAYCGVSQKTISLLESGRYDCVSLETLCMVVLIYLEKSFK